MSRGGAGQVVFETYDEKPCLENNVRCLAMSEKTAQREKSLAGRNCQTSEAAKHDRESESESLSLCCATCGVRKRNDVISV